MDVSVIMINYNTFELAKNALESIFRETDGISYEIVLIDNASPDGSGEQLQALFGDRILYVQAGGNLGTSKAFNLGLKMASGRYILWLNTDILLKENFIKELFDFMEQTPDCGICGGDLLDFEGKPTHSYRRALPSAKTDRRDMSICVKIFRKLFRKRLSSEYNYTGKPLDVGYITGADMMIRRDVIDKIGGFDEDIFMYAEECEFTFRMKKNTTYRAISVPNAHMYHLEGASFSGKNTFSERRFRESCRGMRVYMEKCYGEREAVRFLRRHKRSYLKFMCFCLPLFQIGKWKEYRKKRAIVKELLDRPQRQEENR